MALRSEAQTERISWAIEDVGRLSSARIESVFSGNRICARCGVEINARRHLGMLRILEFILNCLYVVLLIAIVLSAGYVVDSWAKHSFELLSDHWVRHEPLNAWNL